MTSYQVLSEREKQEQIFKWNTTAQEYPRDKCIHELFEEQVRCHPDAVAVTCGEQSLTYGQLNERANRLAHYLRHRGVRPDSRVGICIERGIGTVLSMLGVLKAGGAYVPLDLQYPAERLDYMVSDSKTLLVLVDRQGQKIISSNAKSTPMLDLQEDEALWAQFTSESPDTASVGLRSNHLAYVIYTSGSTGQPKGVMVEHRSVVNYLVWQSRFTPWGMDDRVLHKIPISFDASVSEIFGALIVGSQLLIAKQAGERDVDYIAWLIEESKVTTVGFAPSTLRNVLAKGLRLDRIKVIRCGGELLSEELAEKILATVGRDKGLANVYGPTEATIAVSFYEYRSATGGTSVPIGKPISNVMFYVLDEHMQLVPTGVEGELFIGGDCLARGYLGRPQMTAEKFVPNPFTDTLMQSDRLYKTGDRVRRLPSGDIVFLGRNDQQVKIRGYRVELCEIEIQLRKYEGVCEAVVLAREDLGEEMRLVAYYTVDGEVDLNGARLREHLQRRVPAYMVPAAYVRLETLPLMPNGKLDRKALPGPDHEAYAHQAYEAPDGEVEMALAAIWQHLLKVERVGRQDDFFQLGGHSLLATMMVSRIEQALGVEIDIRTVFENSTLERLSKAIWAYPAPVDE